MEDRGFVIYSERYVYLGGSIRNGCLTVDSEVYGGDDFFDSEQHVFLSRKETEKLFSVCSLDEFVEIGRRGHYGGLLQFLDENNIEYDLSGY